MKAVVRFGALTKKLERLQDEQLAVARDRMAVVADLAETMPYREVGQLLGISAARVGQLVVAAGRDARPQEPRDETGEGE